MLPFLELEAIEVDSPPPSPVWLAEVSIDIPSPKEIANPVKRVRSVGHFNKSKRQKKDGVPSYEHVSDRSTHTLGDSNWEAPDIDVEVDGYTAFTTAVAESRAGVYPLSEDLFVVRGWDDKLQGVKVNSSPCQ